MRYYKACLILCAGLLLNTAAYSDEQQLRPASSPTAAAAATQRYIGWFHQAANEFNVPVELLQAIAFAETRWRPHVPKNLSALHKDDEEILEFEYDPTHHHAPPVYGIMGLRDDKYFGNSVQEGARLIGTSPDVVKTDTQQNIRAAAAVLASLGNGKNRYTPLEEWEEAVARYSGIPQRDVAQIYSYEVLNTIKHGRDEAYTKVDRRAVDLEKAYGKKRLQELSAPFVQIPVDNPPAR